MFRLIEKIIVTGADGMGKTTLIQQLTAPPFNFPFMGHDGGPPKTRVEAANRMIDFAMAPPSIRDRHCPIDDPVYDLALDRSPLADVKFYDNFLEGVDPAIIYVETEHAEISHAKKIHKPPTLLQAVEEEAEAVRKAFQDRITHLEGTVGLRVYHYDWREEHDPHELVRYLIDVGVVKEV